METSSPNAPFVGQQRPSLPLITTGGRGLILVGVATGTGAAVLGWPLLVAAGLAPTILAVAPCAFMCALGFCVMGAQNACSATPNHHDGRSAEPQKDSHNA